MVLGKQTHEQDEQYHVFVQIIGSRMQAKYLTYWQIPKPGLSFDITITFPIVTLIKNTNSA